MNKVILMGRLTREPDVRYSQNVDGSMAIARYTLAVDRRRGKDQEQTADFISCVAFGKSGEFAEKYLHQGTKIAVTGRIQTGSLPIRMVRKCILQMWLWKTMSLRKVNLLQLTHHQDQNQARC